MDQMINWSNLREEVNDNIISDLEKELYITFPESFISFIKKYHGSSPSPNVIEFGDEKEIVKSFVSFDPKDEDYIVKIFRENCALLPEDIIPIALTDCIDLICLDYRNGRIDVAPQVVYWNYDFALLALSDDMNINDSVYPICSTFEKLISMITL